MWDIPEAGRIQSPRAVTWHPVRGWCITRTRKLTRNLICSGTFAVKTQILFWSFVAGLKKRDRSCLFVFNSCGFDQTVNRKPSSQWVKVTSDMRKQLPVQLPTSSGHTFTHKLHIQLYYCLLHLWGLRWRNLHWPLFQVDFKIFSAASRSIE